MLRLLIVALPLVVALPAAFDNQETNAIQFEVQSTLQLEVRSPPESRPLLPAATREQHTTAPPHTPLRTHNTQAHTSACMRRGTRARARRSTPRSTSSPTSSSQEHQPITRRCDHRPRASSHACSARSFRSALPLRARPGHMLQVHTRTCTVRSRAASPVLLTACALLSRCRQPQLRAVGHDGHRALDI